MMIDPTRRWTAASPKTSKPSKARNAGTQVAGSDTCCRNT
jgi:hypothetical protein